MKSKVASCHCGKLSLTCLGEPMFVAMCHCQACQRWTGSSYNLGAWYQLDNFTIEGSDKVFRRSGESDMELSYHFCPECGSNVYWEVAGINNAVGVAGGCFADAGFPQPSFSIFGEHQHQWVTIPEGVACHSGNYPREDEYNII